MAENPKPKLDGAVTQLGIVSFFADIASEMLYPIVPIFLTVTLGASMTSIGFIEGIAEAIASLLKTYSGYWSDRLRRRKIFIFTGYFLSAISKSAMGLAVAWPGVLVARSLDRVGKGLRTAPRDAMLGEVVPMDRRGEAFGIHRAMDTAGAVLGPLVALLYLQSNSDLRLIFLYALIPGLFATALVLTLKEVRPRETREKPTLHWSKLPPKLRRYILIWAVFCAVNSSDAFLLLRAKELGMSLTETILVYCFFNLIYASMSPWFGKRSDEIGKRKILVRSLGLFAIVYLGFAWADSTAQIWTLFGIYGLFMAASEGVGKAYALDLATEESKATALGIFATVSGFASIFASTFGGFLWDRWGSPATFVFGAAGALGSLLLLQFKAKPALHS